MGEPCFWHMKAAGTREGVTAFGRMLHAAELYDRKTDGRAASMPRIRGVAYDTWPDIHGVEDAGDGRCTIEAWGSSKYSLEPMTGGECEENEILLQEAAGRAGVTVEVFGDAYALGGMGSMDFHLLIGPDGVILKDIAAESIHEWLDNFEDDEELIETARPVLEEMGKPLPEDTDEARKALDGYIDDDEYIDIRPFEWIFEI